MAVLNLGSHTAFSEFLNLLAAWELPLDEVTYILHDAVTERILQPRQQLFAQGADVEYVYLLTEGNVYLDRISTTSQGQNRISMRHEVHAGSLIGHYDLLYGQKHTTRARALDVCRVLQVTATALNRLLYRYPKLRQHIAPMQTIGRLRTIPLLAPLDLTAISYLAESSTLRKEDAGATIYSEGDPAQAVYIIDQGQVQVTNRNGIEVFLGNGMAFGFLEHIYPQAPGQGELELRATAVTLAETTIYEIPRQILIDVGALNPEQRGRDLHQQRENVLQRINVFSRYSQQEKRILLGYMSHVHVPIHHLVMQQGELGDSLWILMPGSRASLRALDSGQAMQPTTIQGPNFFSELALRVEHALDSTVEAEPGSQWLRLHTDDFQAFIQQEGEQVLERLTMSPAAEKTLGRSQTRQRYAWLQKGENLILFQRRHWLVLVRKTLWALIIFLATIVGTTVFWAQILSMPLLIFPLALLGLVAIVQFAWGLLDYLNDYLLVTNQRLVRQEKVLFLAEWRQAAFLEQIRNVDVFTNLLGSLFQYGDLEIHTAATDGSITFDFVPDPHTVRQSILEQQALRQQHYQASGKMMIQSILEERLGLQLRMPARVRLHTVSDGGDHAISWWQKLLTWLNIDWRVTTQLDDRIIWRKHWFILTGKLSAPLTSLLLVVVLIVGEQLLPAQVRQFTTPLDIVWAGFGLVFIAWSAWVIADWRNDTYEVDNELIADVAKKPLFFAENRRTALLGEIENIEVSIPSPLHYMLNFGNVKLQTAASQGDFTFDWVPDPRGVSEEVRRRIELYRQEQEAKRSRQRAQELPDWFEMYNRLDDRSLVDGES